MTVQLEGPRLRQVALVAYDCEKTAAALQETFAWPDPFRDPGVSQFGLVNAVFTVGDTFVEVVSPVEPSTTAGRYLARRGGESGYMAIFQLPDLGVIRQRMDELGVRVVWKVELPDIAGNHLHPKDTPGAIVSLDWAMPAESWRWAGPQWTGTAPDHTEGGITGITVEAKEPTVAARRWAAVLGLTADVQGGEALVHLPEANQTVRFVPGDEGRGEGISEVWLDGNFREAHIAGVRFVVGAP